MVSNLKKIVYLFFVILIIAFIFYNSIKNGDESTNASTVVLNYINNFFEYIQIDIKLTGHFIRKMAHFIEFFVLGFFSMLFFKEVFGLKFEILGYPLFLSTLIPILDEYIQKFSKGRSSQVSDILIDFSGAFFGIVLGIIISYIIKKIQQNKKYTFFKGNYIFR